MPVQARICKIDFCCEELGIYTGENFQTKAYMALVSKQMTQICTPCVCSSALAPGFDIGSKKTPKWIYIGSDGAPYFGDEPETFKAKEISRTGLPLLNTDGIYTTSQRENMVELHTKGGCGHPGSWSLDTNST